MEQHSPAGAEGAEAYVLDEQVGFVLRQVQQRHATLFSATLGSDLTPTQWAVLAKLAEVGEISQNLLGRHTAMDNVTIKGVVERLVKRGLIKANRDAGDRRRFSISLSEEGRRIYAERVALAIAVSRETLEPLTAGEKHEFQRLLLKLR
jgi:MarR family transcriptional regulator, lower aerobic nicotinate degradation pathway regulator